MAERHVTLIRHGEHDRESRLMGGGDLTERGIEQAKQLAIALTGQYPITSLYSSTLRRAVHTAHIIAKAHRPNQLPFQQNENLSEAVFHVPEKHADRFKQLSSDNITTQRIRVAYAYNSHMVPVEGNTDEHDVLVTHGNVIRYFTMRAIGAAIEQWATVEIYHTGLSRFIVQEDKRVRFVSHNEVGHLPRRLWTVH